MNGSTTRPQTSAIEPLAAKAEDNANLPFAGVRVLSFAQLGQGPAAVQNLADFGADVIKIERPVKGAFERSWSGANAFRDGESFFFLALNRNQKSLTLDLKSEEGREIALELVRGADVLVENFRPGVMDRIGLGYEALSKENSRLIYCSSSGFGSTGPYKDRPAQDLIVQSMSGLASMTGRAGDAPTPVGSPVVDFHASALMSFGITMALLQRTRTNRGQRVETSLLEAAIGLQFEPFFYHLNGWNVTTRSRAGVGTPFHQAPYGIYATADGHICLSIAPLSAIRRLIDLPNLADVADSEALTKRDMIKQAIDPIIASRVSSYWLKLFGDADIWCGPVLDYQGLIADPQFKASDFVVPMTHPVAGDFNHIRPLVRLSDAPADSLPRARPPQLGEHVEIILEGLGRSPEEIESLRSRGVV